MAHLVIFQSSGKPGWNLPPDRPPIARGQPKSSAPDCPLTARESGLPGWDDQRFRQSLAHPVDRHLLRPWLPPWQPIIASRHPFSLALSSTHRVRLAEFAVNTPAPSMPQTATATSVPGHGSSPLRVTTEQARDLDGSHRRPAVFSQQVGFGNYVSGYPRSQYKAPTGAPVIEGASPLRLKYESHMCK
jgi:hypothetical protein